MTSKSSSVSDQEALQALLQSAEASLASKQSTSSTSRGNRWGEASSNKGSGQHRGVSSSAGGGEDRGGGSHGNVSHKRRRDDGRRGRSDEDDVGYYGPSQNPSREGHGSGPGRPGKVGYDDDPDATKRNRHSLENERHDVGGKARDNESAEGPDPANKVKPDFGLSGALSKDVKTGNMYKGVLLKFREPPEARAPHTLWRLYVYKLDDLVETLHVNRQSAYLFGKNTDVCDVVLMHPSCSSQHAVLQYRAVPHPTTGQLHCQPYLMDLESTNGTFLNGVRLDSARYYQLKEGDVLQFGASTREYVLIPASSKQAKTINKA